MFERILLLYCYLSVSISASTKEYNNISGDDIIGEEESKGACSIIMCKTSPKMELISSVHSYCDINESLPITESKTPILEVATLGRAAVLGGLYSTYSEKILPSLSLWDQPTIDTNTNIDWIPSASMDFVLGESQEDAYKNLGVHAALSVSLSGGLIKGSGSATYLDIKKDQANRAQVRMSYLSQTRSESLSSCLTGRRAPRCPQESLKEPYSPTHVITQIIYGGNAHFVFEQEVKDNEDKLDIQGQLEVTINLEFTKIHGSAKFSDTQNSSDFSESLKIQMFSDFIVENQPTTVNETIALYQSISSYLGSEENMYNESVPMKMVLVPIKQFCPEINTTQEEVDQYAFDEAISIYDTLTESSDKVSILLGSYAAQYNLNIKDLLLDFQNQLNNYMLSFGENITTIIPLVRSDPNNLPQLIDLISAHQASCFKDENLYSYLSNRSREVNALNIFYAQTVNKNTPKMAEYQKALIPRALILTENVFLLSLKILSNTENEKFGYVCAQAGLTKTPWYDDRKKIGKIGRDWRDFMAFQKSNYNVTSAGQESAYLVNITEGDGNSSLQLYLNGEYKGQFKIPDTITEEPKVCRKLQDTLFITVVNPSEKTTESDKVVGVSVSYKLSYINDTQPPQNYKAVVADIAASSPTTLVTITDIDSEQSYNFTVSYVTKYGNGPPSKIFQTFGPLETLRKKPRCDLQTNSHYDNLNKLESDLTVNECAEKVLSNISSLQNAANIPSTLFVWNYNFVTKTCYTIGSDSSPPVRSVDWVAGSLACGEIYEGNVGECGYANGTVDGGWSNWSAWSECSVFCGTGVRTSKRSCTNPSPANFGAPCRGDTTKPMPCSDKRCIVQMQLRKRGADPKSFQRDFAEYKDGFKTAEGETWLGLENLHKATSHGDWTLFIHVDDYAPGVLKSAIFDNFKVGPGPGYKFTIGKLKSGTDSFSQNQNIGFSTRDKNQGCDANCVNYYGGGGWWHKKEQYSNLNGLNSKTPPAKPADKKPYIYYQNKNTLFWAASNMTIAMDFHKIQELSTGSPLLHPNGQFEM